MTRWKIRRCGDWWALLHDGEPVALSDEPLALIELTTHVNQRTPA